MEQNEFIGMLIGCLAVIIPLCIALITPLTKNTKQMTELTETMKHLIERMNDQEKALEKHEEEFQAYKEHVSEGQRRQWDRINEHHDKLLKQGKDIESLKEGR